jgi:hypothetical protein
MDRKRIGVVVGVVVALAVGLWLRHHFAPTNVIRRSLLAGIEAFEQERILGALRPLSHSYEDRWGMSFESLVGHMKTAMDTYDDLQVDLEPPQVSVEGEEASTTLRFILWGSYEGTRGYVIGSLSEPCTATLRWRKEAAGWRITSVSQLDIPELRDELAGMEKPPE